MRLLAYVQLRNIHGSTGHGRFARQVIEHLSEGNANEMRILADHRDHEWVVEMVGAPWSDFRYQFFRHETSQQQAMWLVMGRPTAEQYWADADLVYCSNHSYVPTGDVPLAVTMHDAHF